MDKIGATARWLADWFLALSPAINCALGLIAFVYIVNRLLMHSEHYTRPERIGMGLTASGVLMVTPALWMAETPFHDWSTNVGRAGVVLYIISGGMRRDRHARRNAAQAEIAARVLAQRGKL